MIQDVQVDRSRGGRKVFVVRGIACLVLVGVFTSGCSRYHEDKWSRARPRTVRAAGVVEYQGKPVEGAIVTFISRVEDRNREYDARGYTDAKGRFRLKTFREDDGAVVGTHRVRIEKDTMEATSASTNGGPAASAMKLIRHLPKRYGSFDTSGLTAEVTQKGPNQFVFQLEDAGPVVKEQVSRR